MCCFIQTGNNAHGLSTLPYPSDYSAYFKMLEFSIRKTHHHYLDFFSASSPNRVKSSVGKKKKTAFSSSQMLNEAIIYRINFGYSLKKSSFLRFINLNS